MREWGLGVEYGIEGNNCKCEKWVEREGDLVMRILCN
jgi:hypothetical protein